MGEMLQSRVKKFRIVISSLLIIWVFTSYGYAQSTLLPGDLLAVTINSSDSTLEIVTLHDLEENTGFSIKTRSNSKKELNVHTNLPVSAGTVLLIDNSSNELISVEGELSFSDESDQLTFIQYDGLTRRILFAAQWGESFATLSTEEIPLIKLQNAANHQYHLKNGASGTHSMIRNMILNGANWRHSGSSFQSFRTSFRVLAPPVVVFDQNISTVMEGDSIPLNVAIYGHDGSRLTVDVVLNQEFSTTDTNDVNSFEKYTYNFTGLIGDAVYEITIPQVNDEIFEDRETVFFELRNLSAGNFGDFVSHASFIIDDEIPDIKLFQSANSNSTIELINYENAYVDLSGWAIRTSEAEYIIGNNVELTPFETRILVEDNFIKLNDESESDFELKSLIFELINKQKISVAKFEKSTINNENLVSDIVEDIYSQDQPIVENIVITAPEGIQSISAENPTMKISKPKVPWVEVSASELINYEYVEFWDEKSSLFRSVNQTNIDSVENHVLFKYSPIDTVSFYEFELVQDSTDGVQFEQLHTEWNITLSATDSDENGFINDAEGYNLVRHNGSDSLNVYSFITELESEVGIGKFYPVLFVVDDYGLISKRKMSDFIYPGELFWIKADSVIQETSLTIAQDIIQSSVIIQDELTEPVSVFSLTANSENHSDTLFFNFYDEDVALPLSQINPLFDLPLNELFELRLNFGAYHSNNWNSEIQLFSIDQTQYSFPLSFITNSSTEISISLSEWNMEGGWRIYIEDTETFNREELYLGSDFSYEFVLDEFIQNDSDDNPSIKRKNSPIERFNLVLESPGFELAETEQPEQIVLNQNYPNPFNPATTISFYIPEPIEVKLSVFNVVGQPIAILEQGVLTAGEHQYEWNASAFPSGMYIYQLEVGTKVMTRKMTLVK